MEEYFRRQIELWGEKTQNSLKEKKIAIIGCGGLGTSLALALGSSGIGSIDLVDFDFVSLHNIHRQIIFKIEDVGEYKAKIVEEFLKKRYDRVNICSFKEDFESYSKRERRVDLILDATDNLPVRVKIDTFAKRYSTPWIYGSVEEFNGQICFFDKSSFKAFKITDREAKGIATPIVMNVASLQANLAIRYLTNLKIEKDKLHYLFFNQEGEFIIEKFAMPI